MGTNIGESTDVRKVACVGSGNDRICYEDKAGFAIYQGDVILGRTDDIEKHAKQSSMTGKSGFLANPSLWERTIPYSFADVSAVDQDNVRAAFAHYESSLGFRFVLRSTEADYIEFRRAQDAGVCRSFLGRVGGGQILYLASTSPGDTNCIVHELGHALGMIHEQSRPDRDANVVIHWENIPTDRRVNFDIDPTADTVSTPYDVGSVMHYAWDTFSSNGKPAITRLNGSIDGLNYKTRLSAIDIAGIANRYATVLADAPAGNVELIASGGKYVPVNPTRVLDSRSGIGFSGKIPGGQVRSFPISALAAPQGERIAYALNVTVTEPEGPGYLTVYPCGRTQPNASNVNYGVGQSIPNWVSVAAVPSGVCVYSSTTTHVVADLNGYHSNAIGDGYVPIAPERVLDSRNGIGGRNVALSAGESIPLALRGTGSVSAAATAALLNVTVTEPRGPGFLTAYPCDSGLPNASNLNFVMNQTVPNAALVKLDASGRVCLYSTTATHVIVDVNGFTAQGPGSFSSVTPLRLLDSRSGLSRRGTVSARLPFELPVAGRNGVPSTATSVVLNVAVTQPSAAGFLTVFPCGTPVPNASNLNFSAGMTIANHVVAKLGAGSVCFYSSAETHLVADIGGYFTP